MKPAVFLDRDGTINVEKNYLYRIEDFEYIDGAVEALQKLHQAGFLLVVVTNQSGIARGYYSEEDFRTLNGWMRKDLQERGVPIASVYYCPHHPQAVVPKYRAVCDCRKPAAGLFQRAIRELDIDVDKSYAVGDKLRDLAICEEEPVQGILLGNEEMLNTQKAIWCADSLKEAAERILKDS